MFEAAIDDLRSRAKNAKTMSRIVFIIFVFLSGSAFLIVFSNVIASTNIMPSVANEVSKTLRNISDASEKIASNIIPSKSFYSDIESSQIETSNQEGETNSDKAREPYRKGAHGTLDGTSLGGLGALGAAAALWDDYIDYSKGKAVTGSIVTVIYSMLSTFILIYLMQVTLTFTRYYAQLAELYESQAFALIAANGDISVAVEIIKNFSSRDIPLGKFPVSMYEKLLEIATRSADKK
ncbi:hypothetical protein NMF47_04825 [Serratia nevei]|uniref:hypothetical protein n=1 Tax=Serratia TaxID=613 RepID=UPI0027944C5E|nr:MULTISPECIES: hypothetical protein [Serratia]ELD1857054.1 hypothetical protein [Serratia marcescens]ELM0002842.1 hypothetical protein [Serratia marcescens]MDP8026046.1 hypothetical protein [Serratia marcescens]MDQ7767816.1 hypothetical protein [Serratia nevei]HBH7555531.1 hypothetical protein [Serratia marcescens]